MSEYFGQLQLTQLDQEWIQLINEAKQLGFSFDEIQQFFQQGRGTK